ncbi:hypothetical protein [Mesorhizobium mediterraneum]|uniref:hypothetical protein n=1 Tax=Mesorhizobium mediterraneum TaxID=43617 RepID=UPI001783B163|nr:hypothetical protein [Mesorhizobium mediterraneum]
MSKKIGTNLTYSQIGHKIVDIWRASASQKKIDREAVIAEFQAHLNTGSTGPDKKTIIYDVITDQEIDENTRMVWICVPSPDTKGSWVAYANSLSAQDIEDLGKAVLFGCGR